MRPRTFGILLVIMLVVGLAPTAAAGPLEELIEEACHATGTQCPDDCSPERAIFTADVGAIVDCMPHSN